jgi:hypothetical protein
MKRLLPVLASALLPLALASAGEATPQLAERGKSLLSDDFAQLDKGWHSGKGKWEVAAGAVRGAELPADKHAGVTRHDLAFENAIIQIEVKLDGAKASTISINAEKGHLARVLLNPAGFSAQKDDSDHEGPDTAKNFGRLAVSLKPGEWHQVQVELIGDTMVATLDGANVIAGSDASFTKKKANLGLTVLGESASFRNLRVWEATPKAGWEATKTKLVTESAEKAKAAPAPAKPAAPTAKATN